MTTRRGIPSKARRATRRGTGTKARRCDGKAPLTRAGAEAMRRRLIAERAVIPASVEIYQCGGHWHVGHKPGWRRKK